MGPVVPLKINGKIVGMSEAGRTRLGALDALRGLIMVVMALDHASYYVSRVHQSERFPGPLPDYDGVAWFLTREFTHLCAPGFFFLMGAGMVLFAASRRAQGWTESQIRWRMVTRGLLMVVLAYLFELPPLLMIPDPLKGGPFVIPGMGGMPLLIVVTLACLGLTYALCGLLMRLSTRSWLAIGFIAIMAPNFLLPTLRPDTVVSIWLRLFLVPGVTGPLLVSYPVLPWLGISALGAGFGHLLLRNRDTALRAMLPMGIAYLLGYAGIRVGGGFGNLVVASGHGWIDWFTVVKYPPSLAFCLLTLGVNFVLLSCLHRAGAWLEGARRLLAVYGQAPLFYYAGHLWLYFAVRQVFFRQSSAPLWLLLVVWLGGVAAMYPACLWYRRFKEARPAESVWRML
jgi:uncharacterized membrane protein